MIPRHPAGRAPGRRHRQRRQPRRAGASAFTLIEVLAAMAVLLLVMVLALQLFDGAVRATTQSNRQMDIGSEARLVFDRLGEDFNAMVRRADVDSKFDKKAGSDAIAFYAEAPGYATTDDGAAGATPTPTPTPNYRTLATLDYRIHQGNGTPDVAKNFKLERGARALAYTEMLFSNPPTPYTAGSQTYAAGLSPFNTLPMIRAEDYTVVGDQTFRLEFCYLLKNGHFSKSPNPPGDLADASSASYRPDPGNFRQVAALVVAVVMLDARSRTLLGDPRSAGYLDAFGRLTAAFPDVDPDPNATGNQDILSVWQPLIAKISTRQEPNTAALPSPVIGNLRVFQRYYYWK